MPGDGATAEPGGSARRGRRPTLATAGGAARAVASGRHGRECNPKPPAGPPHDSVAPQQSSSQARPLQSSLRTAQGGDLAVDLGMTLAVTLGSSQANPGRHSVGADLFLRSGRGAESYRRQVISWTPAPDDAGFVSCSVLRSARRVKRSSSGPTSQALWKDSCRPARDGRHPPERWRSAPAGWRRT